MKSLMFSLDQAKALVAFFDGDKETSVTVVRGKGHSGKGLYAYHTGCPEEGAMFLGKGL